MSTTKIWRHARNIAMAAASVAAMNIAGAHGQDYEGDYLYHVATLRAEPGKLEAFLDFYDAIRKTDFFEAGFGEPLLIRHSQGDQWDLMYITPMESWTVFHSRSNTRKREAAGEKHSDALVAGRNMLAFAEDHFAYGPSLEDFIALTKGNDFFHIEMFHAAAGKQGDLAEQRRMENAYLEATGQTQNMIFRRAAGSDVDVFTIGAHESLQAFAAPSPASDEEKEAAAKAAGFKDRADISFYLRSLITSHKDTLANRVKEKE